MNKKEQTIQSYNENAEGLADKFNKSGTREKDIADLISLLEKEKPFILEIGCANGRDAKEILKYTDRYIGMDVSEKLIEIAKAEVPKGDFKVADIEEYQFPENLDAVASFATLIHLDREVLGRIFNKVYQALNTGGLFRISMKRADEYVELTKDTPFGIRTYYYYSEDDLKELGKDFELLKMWIEEKNGQEWVEVLFRK